MSKSVSHHLVTRSVTSNGTGLIVATGLAVASMIVIPALATRYGVGASLAGALRMAVMKAGYQAMR